MNTMEEARDLVELKDLISRLGLRDDRRQSPRYTVKIIGNYHIDQASLRIAQGRCWLVDISKEGIAVKIKDATVKEGMLLHLQFLMDAKIVDVTSKVVHIDEQEDGYLVGVRSLNERDDIINQLLQ
jgi:c-di-GMP-binding flagellar brake protein YcgR